MFFHPEIEPKRMYNGIPPFVGFVVLTIIHILVLGGQKPPCYYFLWKCIENSTEFLVYVFEQVSCLKLMICSLMVFQFTPLFISYSLYCTSTAPVVENLLFLTDLVSLIET